MHFHILTCFVTFGKRGVARDSRVFYCCRIKIIAALAANIVDRGAGTTSANLVLGKPDNPFITTFSKDILNAPPNPIATTHVCFDSGLRRLEWPCGQTEPKTRTYQRHWRT
jgi:hypothetical protein